MASTQADLRIRALRARTDTLLTDTQALASMASRGLASPDLAVDIGRALGIALTIDRLAELLANGGIPVALLGLIEREADSLMTECLATNAKATVPRAGVPPQGGSDDDLLSRSPTAADTGADRGAERQP